MDMVTSLLLLGLAKPAVMSLALLGGHAHRNNDNLAPATPSLMSLPC